MNYQPVRYYPKSPAVNSQGLADGSTLNTVMTLGWWALLVWLGYKWGQKS